MNCCLWHKISTSTYTSCGGQFTPRLKLNLYLVQRKTYTSCGTQSTPRVRFYIYEVQRWIYTSCSLSLIPHSVFNRHLMLRPIDTRYRDQLTPRADLNKYNIQDEWRFLSWAFVIKVIKNVKLLKNRRKSAIFAHYLRVNRYETIKNH